MKTIGIKRGTLFSAVLFFSMLQVSGVDLSRQNCAYWYDPVAAVTSRYKVVQTADHFEVYVQLYSQNKLVDSLSFLSQRSYTAENHELLSPTLDTVRSTDQLLIVHFSVPDTVDNLLLLEYRYFQPYYFPIQLKYTSVTHAPFWLKAADKKYTLKNYTRRGTLAAVPSTAADSLYVYRYQDRFPPAGPPMSISNSVSPSLQIDSLLYLPSHRIQTAPSYFYFIQEDSSTSVGVTIYAGGKYFPKLTTLEELLGPIKYIARKSELEKIEASNDQKKAFDSFWLGLYPIKRNASDAIASYYRAVAQANELFTNYKPGWKTDRGMIFLIFGKPLSVTRHDWREVWTYAGGVTFEFRIISNLFAHQQYYLARSQELADPWYDAVKSIRNNR